MPKLSPSRVKTFFECGLKYYYNYLAGPGGTGVPGSSNDGAKRGTVTHDTLQCLSHPKRRARVEAMIEAQDPWIDAPTRRLAYNIAKKLGVHDPDNFELIRSFIVAALNEDFFCDGAEAVEIERHFHIKGEGYEVRGFIDKSAKYPEYVKIIDYKTSNKKFTKPELAFNLQNFFYTDAAQELYPGMPIRFEFHFLKFAPKTIVHAPVITSAEMIGFKEWLKEVSRSIDEFTFEDAKANNPKNAGPGKSWLCGKKELFAKKVDGTDAWYCDFRMPFIYFALLRNGKTIATDKVKKVLEKQMQEGDQITQCKHPGCWAWRDEIK